MAINSRTLPFMDRHSRANDLRSKWVTLSCEEPQESRRKSYAIPPTFSKVHVLSSQLWLVMDGRDIILQRGQEWDLGGASPVISNIGQEEANFVLFP